MCKSQGYCFGDFECVVWHWKEIPLHLKKATRDLTQGLGMYHLWWALAWQDTKQRYRRSFLGPFWITASTGVMVGCMGPLYGALLGQNVPSYIQYLAISLIIWTFVSSSINEAGSVFVGAENYIKQISLPFSVYVFRLLAKNVLMLAHNAVIVLIVMIFFPPRTWGGIWLLPAGLFLVMANLFWIALLLGMLSARFRDIPQLVSNIIQVAFFLSPIIWKVDMLGPKNQFVANLNPLYHFMELIRAPLLGDSIRMLSWYVTWGLFVVGGLLTYFVFVRFRARIPYWL